MASASVEEELQCPICMEFLTDPVTLDCGHNFCRGCITKYCEKWKDLGDLECPLCKAKMKKVNFRPNFSLANIVEKIKLLSLNAEKEGFCVRHKERLHLFCKEDEELVCLFCERSPEHQSHTVLLLEEAAEEYKATFQAHLEILVNDQERIQKLKIVAKEESQDLLKQVKTERKRLVTEFRQLQEYLKEQENRLLARIEELEDQLVTRRDEHLARLSEEVASLESLIQEMQEKLHQPAGEFLKNVGSTLQKYDRRSTLDNLEAFPDTLKLRSRNLSYLNHVFEIEIKRLKETITLDPDSARSKLFLPKSRKNVYGFNTKFTIKSYMLPKDSQKSNSFAELQHPSREDPVRREENTRKHLSSKEKSKLIRIYGIDSDYEDLS